MNISIRTLTCVAALAAFVPAFAQDEEDTTDAETTEAVPAEGEGEKAQKHISEIDERIFTTLPFCKSVEGTVEMQVPGDAQWIKVDDGRFCPLGSKFRTVTEESRLTLAFGREVSVSVVGLASFSTRQQGLDIKSRSIALDSGTIELKLPLNFPEQMFSVTAPGFSVENPAGVSRYTYAGKSGDGDEALVRCISGVLTVKGRHFTIPAMHAANEVSIRTSHDFLTTILLGKSGDYMCHLDNGVVQEMDYDTQKPVIVEKSLDWKLSPKTAVRIYRKAPEVGKTLSVSVMTFDSNGELRNRCTFAEGRHELNTGDQGPATKQDRARAAKALQDAAAAAVETTEDAPADEEGGEGGDAEEATAEE